MWTIFGTICCGAVLVFSPIAMAADDVAYSTLEVGENCTELSADNLGGSFACPGYKGFPILFSEFDLRTSIFYGYPGEWYGEGAWESFGVFNGVGDTIEWRLKEGIPQATILRWFIDHIDADKGVPTEETRGQILVVSKVAQPGVGEGCVIGYVDARANEDANELAREVADTMADNFTCRVDEPIYHGEEGFQSAEPVRTFGP